MIKLKRAYESATADDGMRVLVERLWPRGLKKADVHVDAWLKEVAPSDALRRWFRHDPRRWGEFRRRYFAELEAKPAAWKPLSHAARRRRVTLVHSAHDVDHNNAVALQQYLEARMRHRTGAG